MKRDWLWDRRISAQEAKTVLNKPDDRHFLSLASLLLSRNNIPKEAFSYLNPIEFIQNWRKIKRQMRKDEWNNPRIEFWQAVYEKLKERHEKKGEVFGEETAAARVQDEFCKTVADKIKVVRKQRGITQKALAKKLRVSQQMISHTERGENISLLTLKKIADSLGAELHLEIG